MLYFCLDASAAARLYLQDVGSHNLTQIAEYPDSHLVAPSLVKVETVSAWLQAVDEEVISEGDYHVLREAFEDDEQNGRVAIVELGEAVILIAQQLLERYRPIPGVRRKLKRADSIYLATAVHLARLLKPLNGHIILVTSDHALYQAAQAEPEVGAFHFWTCDLGCACGVAIIPVKGQRNTCPHCGQTCALCQYEGCPSRHRVAF